MSTITMEKPKHSVVSHDDAAQHDQHDHHHHHHHHASPADLGDRGAFIMQIGVLSNLGLAVIKLLGGWAFKSKSLTADAWHSFTDVTADLLALFAIFLQVHLAKTSLKRSTIATVEHLLSLATAGVLVAAGIHLGWESAVALQGRFLGPEAAVVVGGEAPSVHAIWAAALTILVKETLYHQTMKIANDTKSSVLASNAAHQRADSLMSVVAIVAILGSTIVGNTEWIDAIGGLCISMIMVRAALGSVNAAVRALAAAEAK